MSRISHLTLGLWWTLEITATSAMPLEKQKHAERILYPPEMEVIPIIMEMLKTKVMMLIKKNYFFNWSFSKPGGGGGHPEPNSNPKYGFSGTKFI